MRLALVEDRHPDQSSSPVPVAARETSGEAPQVAVALDSDGAGSGSPRVIAKGRGAVAEQILQIAFDRGVKVRSDADLAEILSAVELESEIPLEALAAVAEILSYVYRAQNGATAEGPAT